MTSQIRAQQDKLKVISMPEYNELLFYRSMLLTERKEKIELMRAYDSLIIDYKNLQHKTRKIDHIRNELFRMNDQVIELQNQIHKNKEVYTSQKNILTEKYRVELSKNMKLANKLRVSYSNKHKVIDAVSYSLNVLLLLAVIFSATH